MVSSIESRRVRMTIVLFVLIIILFGIFGIFCWAASDIPVVLREVALNTRKEGGSGTNYPLMDLLSLLIKIWAVIVWVVGLLAAIAVLQMNDLITGLFARGAL
jgi:hypothetical protein